MYRFIIDFCKTQVITAVHLFRILNLDHWDLVLGAWNFHDFHQTGKFREIGQHL
jgi:hypothetical protein